nr:hypothetical protein [Tanacetum cinerariifolium]
MARPLFNEIVTAVIDHDPFFRSNMDCARRQCIFGLLKCTSAIYQLPYDVHADFLDEYIQISERTSRTALDHFCQAVMHIYGPGFLRKPTVTDIEKLYLHQEEKHGFPGMLGSLDCTDWEWFGCPYAFKAHYVRHDHGPNLFILIEAVASQDLWICHAFFGVAGLNNDINVLYQSPLFNDLKPDEHLRILLWVTACDIFALVKCTSAIRQLAHDTVRDSLDGYLQIGNKTARNCLVAFCNETMELYGEEYLRKPTQTVVEKFYAFDEEKHVFFGMIGSIDCTKWSWAQCLTGLRGQLCTDYSGSDPLIILEAVASQDLWISHAFIGVVG